MAPKPTQKKKFSDPTKALKNSQFLKFAENIPPSMLEEHNLKRYVFWGVCTALAQFGDYDTGTGIYPAHTTLATVSGLSRPTVKKVIDFLKSVGALEVSGHQKNHRGTPSEIYDFRKSPVVAEVLKAKTATEDEPAETQGQMPVSVNLDTTYEEVSTDETLSVNLEEPKCKPGDHNTNKQYYLKEHYPSVDPSNADKESFASESQEDVFDVDEELAPVDAVVKDVFDVAVVKSIFDQPMDVPMSTEEMLDALIAGA